MREWFSHHLRAEAELVIAVVTELLLAKGFTRVELCADTADAAIDPEVRVLALRVDGDWVALADDAGDAGWAGPLSKVLETDVITLDGVSDRSSPSRVRIHADDQEKLCVRFPEYPSSEYPPTEADVRARAELLARANLSVEREAELEPGAILEAVGRALEVPQPLFHVDDASAQRLYFRYTKSAPVTHDPMLAMIQGFLGPEVSAQLEAIAGLSADAAPTAIFAMSAASRAAMHIRAPKLDGPPRLLDCYASLIRNDERALQAAFLLDDAESARGVVIALEGAVALRAIRVRVAGREWTTSSHECTFADVELTQPAPRAVSSHLPFEERMRQGMKRLRHLPPGSNPAELLVIVEGEAVTKVTATLVGHVASAASTSLAAPATV